MIRIASPVVSLLLVAVLAACNSSPADDAGTAGDRASAGTVIGLPPGAGDGDGAEPGSPDATQKAGQAGFAGTPCGTTRQAKAGWERPEVLAWTLLDDCRLLFVATAEHKPYLAGLTTDGLVHDLGPVAETRDDAGLVALAATDAAVWIGGTTDTGAVAVHVDRSSGARAAVRLTGQGVASMARAGDDVLALVVDDERTRLYRLTAQQKAVEVGTVEHPLRHLAVEDDLVVATGADAKRGWAVTGRLSGGTLTSTRLGKNLQSRGVTLVDGQVVAAFEHLDRNQSPDRPVLLTGDAADASSWRTWRGRQGDDLGALAATQNGVVATVSRRGVQAVLRVNEDGELAKWRSFRREESFVTVLGSPGATWIVGRRFILTPGAQRT